MKRFLRSQFEQRAPTIFNGIRAIRHRRMFRQQFSRLHATVKQHLYPNQSPIAVRCGPFRGMHYFDETVWSSITPKWLGSYESELHGVVDQIRQKNYETIIDVGCAEGYYAVGLAVILPAAHVIAFDTDFISRAQIRRLAELNDVSDRIRVGTYCSFSDLDKFSNGRTLVVCDIEGFEAQLLDPNHAPSLLRSDILVEVREALDSSQLVVEPLLHSRFATTHHIERLLATDRDSWINNNRKSLPADIPFDTLREATNERRAGQCVWLWMQAKAA